MCVQFPKKYTKGAARPNGPTGRNGPARPARHDHLPRLGPDCTAHSTRPAPHPSLSFFFPGHTLAQLSQAAPAHLPAPRPPAHARRHQLPLTLPLFLFFSPTSLAHAKFAPIPAYIKTPMGQPSNTSAPRAPLSPGAASLATLLIWLNAATHWIS
jgi:hypothetical protein